MMYLKGLMISQVLVVLVVKSGSALSCQPCYLLPGCPQLSCAGGKVLGLCGCCYVCAKQLDEQCGGLYGLIGTCDRGLRCVLPPQEVNETVTIIYHVGVCQVTAETTPRPEAATQPEKSTATKVTTTRPGEAEGLSALYLKPTLGRSPSTAQQAEAAPQSTKAPRYGAATPPATVPGDKTTASRETSTAQRASSGSPDINTTPDPKLQNGVSAFLRTKGVDALCLVLCLFVFCLI